MSVFQKRHLMKIWLGLGVTILMIGGGIALTGNQGIALQSLGYAQEILSSAGKAVSTSKPPQASTNGKPYPLTVNGKQWTFRTPPPKNLKIREKHPRFLLPGHEEEIEGKLRDPRYGMLHKLAAKRQPMAYQALVYAMSGHKPSGEAAKEYLLGLPATVQGTGAAADVYFQMMIYDWCHDLFTDAEREQAMNIICRRVGILMPEPGSTETIIDPLRPAETKENGFTEWFNNDIHDPSQVAGYLWRGLIALAFHGDGVRDEWCEYVYQSMLHNTDARIYPVYDEKRGGLVDSHNQRALDSGGIQSGWNTDRVMDGYEFYFHHWIVEFMAAWSTATGDDLFTDNNYLRLMPHRVAYRWHEGIALGSSKSSQILLMQTGLYRDQDPEMAGLARWLGEKGGAGMYKEFQLFLLGDMNLPPIHPKDIPRMKLGKYLAGDDICHSRSSWEPDATCVEMFTRAMDTHRYEPDVGGLHIVRKGKPLIMRGSGRKGSCETLMTANTMIWKTGGRAEVNNQGNTYWGGVHLRGPFAKKPWVGRVKFPLDATTNPSYRGPEPTEDHGTEDYHVFTVDSAELRIGRSKPDDPRSTQRLDVDKAKRTIVHLRPNDAGKEFVIVYDRLDVAEDLSHCWAARFLNQPDATATTWYAENDGQAISGSVLTPGLAVEVRGGIPKMTEGPNGESYDGAAKNFYDDGKNKDVQGEYAIYIKPQTIRPQQDYCVVLEVGDAGFVPADATMDGKVVKVGGWTVDFTEEDETKVTR